MRTRTGLPFSGCGGGRLRAAPTRNPNGLRAGCSFGSVGNRLRTNGLRALGTEQAGHRVFGSRTSPAESGAFGQAHCHRLRRSFGSGGVGQDRVSARELRTRHGPRASAHDHVRRNQGFGRGSCPKRIHRLRPLMTLRVWKRDASSESAERRTARASALCGEPAGKPDKASAFAGPRRMWGQDPVLVTAPRNRPLRKACLGGTGREGTVGAGSDAGPHYCLGQVRAKNRPLPVIPAHAGISLPFRRRGNRK